MLDQSQYNDVTKENLSSVQLVIKQLISQATFIAVDTEFSGLGRGTKAQHIEDRYKAFCDLVRSHALLALGLSTFERRADEPKGDAKGGTPKKELEQRDGQPEAPKSPRELYTVNNFSFTLFRETEYTVSPSSLSFLAQSGFDFQKQITLGIPYTPSSSDDGDVETATQKKSTKSKNWNRKAPAETVMRSIFDSVVSSGAPLVVHNGLLDLIFLYHSFYADLPPSLGTFLADLSRMFPGGIYDTKYVADFQTREKASFLAYLYRKYERDNSERRSDTSETHVSCSIQTRISFPQPQNKTHVHEVDYDASNNAKVAPISKGKPFCESYALHGFCKLNKLCGKSHDLDMILDHEEKISGKARKKRRIREGDTQEIIVIDEQVDVVCNNLATPNFGLDASSIQANKRKNLDEIPSPAISNSTSSNDRPSTNGSSAFHSAPFDAYMTGFIFACQLRKFTPELALRDFRNRMYLIGKSIPLVVEKSQFVKCSPTVMERLGGGKKLQ